MSVPPLLQEYRLLQPGLKRLYVIPGIDSFSKHNPYLKYLYEPVKKNAPELSLVSSSFLSPVIIWRNLKGEKSLLHHHWLECHDLKSCINVLWKLLWAKIYRLTGGKVVWTVHNRQPHSNRLQMVNRLLRLSWARIPHRIHVHCQSVVVDLANHFSLPQERFFVVPHPAYPAESLLPEQARKTLVMQYNLPETLMNRTLYLMFGYIAPYKGILDVARIFLNLPVDQHLVIAGAIKREGRTYVTELRRLINNAENVSLIDRYLPDEAVPIFMSAANVCLFNYRDILASGSVALALSYQKELIIPSMGCLADLHGDHIHQFHDLNELEMILKGKRPDKKKPEGTH